MSLSNSWLAPWVTKVLSQVKDGESPYEVLIPTLRGVFYPSTSKSFRIQLWVLFGVFVLSALIILAGLLLRLGQGRFWILHRIDRTILIPNISVAYGLCALVYACLGMISIVAAVRVSLGSAYPRYYVGLQGVWPAVLWTGMYSEIWATFASYYIRRYGAYYRESAFKSILAGSLPFILPFFAYVPPFILFYQAAGGFNSAIREYEVVDSAVQTFQAEWVPADGLDIINLLSILGPVEKMALAIIDYSAKARPAFLYVAATLLVTLIVYGIGAWLEVTHLRSQAAKLRSQMVTGVKFPGSPGLGAASKKVERALMEEWSSNIVRQASLLEWACTNRIWTAAFISLMLFEASATSLWYGLSPLSIKTNSTQFMTIILVSCYMNGVLSTFVSLLILFRSLDGTSATSQWLQRVAPWLPLPPAVTAEGGTTMGATTPTVFFTEQRDLPYEERSSPMLDGPMEGTRGVVQFEMTEKAVHYSDSSSSH